MGRKLFSNKIKTSKTCFQKIFFKYFFRTHTKIKGYTNFNLKIFVCFIFYFLFFHLDHNKYSLPANIKYFVFCSSHPNAVFRISHRFPKKFCICGSRRHRYDVSTRLSISGVRGIFRLPSMRKYTRPKLWSLRIAYKPKAAPLMSVQRRHIDAWEISRGRLGISGS